MPGSLELMQIARWHVSAPPPFGQINLRQMNLGGAEQVGVLPETREGVTG